MAKKYLSLEEAASHLGLSTEELVRRREKGEIRGYADRGTWKFKIEDIDEFRRTHEIDSHPEVPILDEDTDMNQLLVGSDSDIVVEQPGAPASQNDDSDADSSDGTSDSDVRLILDDAYVAGDSPSDEEIEASTGDSDSDVQLVEEPDESTADSDSDVRLAGADSDSDVKLLDETEALTADSDSDVELISDKAPDLTSDSDVRLISDDNISVGDSDSDVSLVGSDDEDSGLTLGMADGSDSGLTLEAADSGISLEGADSGISLEGGDSGISLGDDDDSGLSLTADSGIALEGLADSGIALDKSSGRRRSDMSGTIPLLSTPGDDDLDDTQAEVPAMNDDEMQFLGDDDKAGGADTSVVLFDDDDIDDVLQAEAGKGTDDDLATLDGIEAFDIDESGAIAEVDFDEDAEIDDFEVVDDDDFDESFDSGQTPSSFGIAAVRGTQIAAPVEADWGMPTFIMLMCSSVLLTLCTAMMYDLIRSMWHWQEPGTFNSALLNAFGGLF